MTLRLNASANDKKAVIQNRGFGFITMDVYFDTNIYSHIFNRQHHVTDTEVANLEDAVRDGRLQVFASFSVIEETNAARLSDLNQANGRLELIRTLTVEDRIIKTHTEVIGADIRAYVNGEPQPSKFQAPYPGLKDVFWDHTAKHYKELDSYAQETIDQVNAATRELEGSFAEFIRPLVKESREKKQEPQSFSDYWDDISEAWSEQMAAKYGLLNECKGKYFEGFLDVHSLRVTATAHLSLTYANSYEVNKFHRGNSRDMHHVGCASAVPIFVTHDGALTALLTRVPIPNLEVLSLHTLLERL